MWSICFHCKQVWGGPWKSQSKLLQTIWDRNSMVHHREDNHEKLRWASHNPTWHGISCQTRHSLRRHLSWSKHLWAIATVNWASCWHHQAQYLSRCLCISYHAFGVSDALTICAEFHNLPLNHFNMSVLCRNFTSVHLAWSALLRWCLWNPKLPGSHMQEQLGCQMVLFQNWETPVWTHLDNGLSAARLTLAVQMTRQSKRQSRP